MKIVIVIDSWYGGNGAVVATMRLGKELLARGYEVSIVCTGKHEGEFEFHEVPGFYLPFVKESLVKMNFLFGKGKKSILRKAFQDADLVQVQFPFFMARNSVNLAKEMGIPVIGALHVQPQNITGAMGKENPRIENLLNAFFKFCLFKRVDAIHCPSQFAADLLIKQGIKSHLRVISNGIPSEYRPVDTKRPNWFGDKFVILSIGRHALEKRLELLINGVLKSKYKDNIQLLLCGKGENTDKLKKLGEALPVKPLIDYVSNSDKMDYLNCSDLYLHSSIVELESLTCLEAIGCGLPCLIGNSPHSAASQFALNENFLFKIDDVEDLAKKIDYWYENRESLNAFKADIISMSNKYRFDKSVTEMENLYKDVLIFNEKNNTKDLSEIKHIRENNTEIDCCEEAELVLNY